jgi:hypothetical protein
MIPNVMPAAVNTMGMPTAITKIASKIIPIILMTSVASFISAVLIFSNP